MVHLSDENLIFYANATPQEREAMPAITEHLKMCDSCREKLAHFQEWPSARRESETRGLSPQARALADRLYHSALAASRTIDLTPLTIDAPATPVHLAADGQAEPAPHEGLEHRATLYSENPELVLRLMRNPRTHEESLHLIGADASLTENVLIHIEDPPMDFVTDGHGVAEVSYGHLDNPTTMRWQVRLPDAVFALSPLEHRPEESGASREFEIESDSDNRIGVALKRRDGGVSLRLRLLRIGGRENLERVRLVISQGSSLGRIVETHGAEPCVVSGLSATSPIDIRIFAI